MSDPGGPGDANQAGREGETPPDLFAVRIKVTREGFAELVRSFALDVGCRPHVDLQPDGTGILLAYATEERIRDLRSAGYSVEPGENVTALGRERQKEVGEGDRFRGGRSAPRGLGKKTTGERERGPAR